MSCPTCRAAMVRPHPGLFYCLNCGTMMDTGTLRVPKLVTACRAIEHHVTASVPIAETVKALWHRDVDPCLHPPPPPKAA